MKKKLILFVGVCFLTLMFSIFASNFNSFTVIQDAVVNEINGDVTLAYATKNGIRVKSYKKNGDLLLSNYYNSSGGSAVELKYVNSNLFVYIVRTDELYIYDENMKILSKNDNEALYASFTPNRDNWMHWNKNGSKKSYSRDEIEYIYYESSFFKRILGMGECQFYIQDTNGNQISIYHSD